MYYLRASKSPVEYCIWRLVMIIFWMCISWFITFFCLYLVFRNVEYKESIRRLITKNEELKEANNNLSQIIQEDINVRKKFEAESG